MTFLIPIAAWIVVSHASLPTTPRASDVKAKIVAAIDGTLNIGNADPVRGQWVTHWNVEAIDWYRGLDVAEDEIASRVRTRVRAYLDAGRALGLDQATGSCAPLLEGATAPAGLEGITSTEQSFLERHDLMPYLRLRQTLGAFDRHERRLSAYGLSLPYAYAMARAVGAKDLANEAMWQLLQLGRYEDASKLAEEDGSDRLALIAGYLALVEFYGGRYPLAINTMHEVVEALKRVQGAPKAEANQLMFDIAKELTSRSFLSSVPPDQHPYFLDYAMRLLRSTGEYLRQQKIDATKTNFITTVRGPVVTKAIRDLISRLAPPDADEALEGLAAIGDRAAIDAIADGKLRTPAKPDRKWYGYARALDLYEMTENAEGVKRVLNVLLAGTISFPNYLIPTKLVRATLATEGPSGLPRLLALIERRISAEPDHRTELQQYREDLLAAIAAKNFDRFDSPYERAAKPKVPDAGISRGVSNLLRQENGWRAEFARVRAESTPQTLAENRRAAREALAKNDGWTAKVRAIEGLDFDALMAAGDLMLKNNDGLNAVGTYLAALVLMSLDQ